MMTSIYGAIVIGLTIWVTTRLILVIHEFGHGIPALLFTEGEVKLFIGSHGDPNDSLKLKIGRLKIFLKYNLLNWTGGLCMPEKNARSINKSIIILLLGPCASLIIAAIITYLAFKYDVLNVYKFLILFFMLFAFIDFMHNIVPSKTPIKLYDGNIIYNDGEQIRRYFSLKRLPADYTKGFELYEKQQYKEASTIFQTLLDEGIDHENLYRLSIPAYMMIGDYPSADKLLKPFSEKHTLISFDYKCSALVKKQLKQFDESLIEINKVLELDPNEAEYIGIRGEIYFSIRNYDLALIDFDKALEVNPKYKECYNSRGYLHGLTGNYTQAIDDFSKCLEIDPQFTYALTNRSYTYNLAGQYEKAMIDFDKVIELDGSDTAYAYCNRGLSKIKLGRAEEGLKDIQKAVEIDATNAYAYRNLGIYHLEKGEFNEALRLFEKSKELDKETHLIDDLITETTAKI
jgi:tetratricopeptide (TPR) repeat protein